MKRIVPIIAVVIVLGVAAYFLFLRPKGGAKKPRKTKTKAKSADASGTSTKTPRRRGRTAGRIKPKTKKELRREKRERRKEERRRRREERRRKREERRRLKEARKRRRRRKTRRGRKGQTYVVSAIVSLGPDSYALVDGRRVTEGDVVMGRRIVSIGSDRLEVEAFGKRTTVRVGESLMPDSYFSKRRSRS